MLVHGDPCFRLFKIKETASVHHLIDSSTPAALRTLDVTILRDVIIGYGVGVDNENIEGHIEYHSGPVGGLGESQER